MNEENIHIGAILVCVLTTILMMISAATGEVSEEFIYGVGYQEFNSNDTISSIFGAIAIISGIVAWKTKSKRS